MSEQKILLKPKLNLFKKWWFWTPVVLLVLLTWWLVSPSAETPKTLSVEAGERLVVSGLNLGIAQSAVDGRGEITNFECLTLSKIAMRNGGNFFSDSSCERGSVGFIAKKTDTAQSNGVALYERTGGSIANCTTNIATFTFNKEGTELVSYSFHEGNCFQGSKLPISEVNVTTTQELTVYSDKYQHKQAE